MTALTQEFIERIRTMREDGVSFGAIAARLGVSKGVICGANRRHVLGIRETVGVRRIRQPRRRVTEEQREQRRAESERRRAEAVERKRVAAQERAAREKARAAAQPQLNPVARCQFPLGDKPFRFCDIAVKHGRPYCAAHCAICYRLREPELSVTVLA